MQIFTSKHQTLDTHWKRGFFFIFLFLINLSIGLISPHLPLKGIFLVIIGIGVIFIAVLAIKNMPFVITFLITTSATVDITINTGRSTPLPFGLLAVAFMSGVWLIRMVISDHRIHFVSSPINKPFLLFILSAAISWIAGYAIWDAWVPKPDNILLIQAGQFAIFVCSFAATLLVANYAISEKVIKGWVVIIICIGAVVLLIRTFLKSDFLHDIVIGSMFMWPFLLLWGQMLFNSRLKSWMYIIGVIISVIWVYWLFSQGLTIKGGWLPAVLGLGLMIWFKNRKIFIYLVVLMGLVIIFNWNWADQHIIHSSLDRGDQWRLTFWWDVIRMTLRSPILGLGPANYMFYWKDPFFIPLGRVLYGWDVWNTWGYAPPSHNMFVDIFAQTGLIGLVLFIWGIVASLKISYRAAKHFEPGFKQAFAFSVFCGFVSLCFNSFLIAEFLMPFVYNLTITGFRHSVYSWLLLGAVIALYQSTKGDKHEFNT